MPGWAVGVVLYMSFGALGEYEREHGGTTAVFFFPRYSTEAYNEALMPSVSESLSRFKRGTLPTRSATKGVRPR